MRGGVSGETGSPAVSDECYLLWGDVKTDRPQVDLPVVVHAGNDEEDPGTLRSSFPQPAQSEDDGSLVLLHHLHCDEETEGEGDHDEEEGEESDETGAEPRPVHQIVCSHDMP